MRSPFPPRGPWLKRATTSQGLPSGLEISGKQGRRYSWGAAGAGTTGPGFWSCVVFSTWIGILIGFIMSAIWELRRGAPR